jgi:hypothetical protein
MNVTPHPAKIAVHVSIFLEGLRAPVPRDFPELYAKRKSSRVTLLLAKIVEHARIFLAEVLGSIAIARWLFPVICAKTGPTIVFLIRAPMEARVVSLHSIARRIPISRISIAVPVHQVFLDSIARPTSMSALPCLVATEGLAPTYSLGAVDLSVPALPDFLERFVRPILTSVPPVPVPMAIVSI